jgi:hypothetical protein
MVADRDAPACAPVWAPAWPEVAVVRVPVCGEVRDESAVRDGLAAPEGTPARDKAAVRGGMVVRGVTAVRGGLVEGIAGLASSKVIRRTSRPGALRRVTRRVF